MLPHRRMLALSLAVAVLGACASPALPGVSVRSVQTDVGLGVVLPEASEVEPVAFPELPDFPLPTFNFDPPAPVVACPTAPLLDFPIGVTTSVRPGVRPAEGSYRWVHDLTITDAEQARQFLPPWLEVREGQTFREFGSRVVRGVIDSTEEAALGSVDPAAKRDTFQFTEDIVPGLLPTVNTAGRGDIYRVHPRSLLDSGPTTGDTGEGIVDLLTAYFEFDEDNNATSWIMVYSPPPLLIQFPIGPGQRVRWATSGQPVNAELLTLVPQAGLPDPSQIDPQRMRELGENAFGPKYTFNYEGVVGAPQDVDACGNMVQFWPVLGNLTIGANGQEVKLDYDYGIATQFGGLIVYERFALPATVPALRLKTPSVELRPESTPWFELVAFIGQEKPSTPSE